MRQPARRLNLMRSPPSPSRSPDTDLDRFPVRPADFPLPLTPTASRHQSRPREIKHAFAERNSGTHHQHHRRVAEERRPAALARPWAADPNAGFPCNVVSKKKYRGINPLLLQIAAMRHGLKSKWWATFNQWKELGGSVMKRPDNVPPGEWGTAIIFWSRPLKITEEKEDGDEEKTIFMLRTYTVFNIDQVEGEHLDHLRVGHTVINTNPIDTYEEADRVIAATGADIRYGGNAAFYNRAQDYIQVPLREQFTAAEYYETILHELCHWSERAAWTGTARREGYAMGELDRRNGIVLPGERVGHPQRRDVAESCELLAELAQGDGRTTRGSSSKRRQASKAADYILSFSRVEEPEEVAV